MTTYVLRGTTEYCKVHSPDLRFDPETTGGQYSLVLIPNQESIALIPQMGLRNKPSVGTDGKLRWTFRTYVKNKYTGEPYPKPVVVNENNEPITDLIGNGSEISVKLFVDSGTSAKHGKWTRSRIEGVKVHNLIKYEPASVATGAVGAASPQPTPVAGGTPW